MKKVSIKRMFYLTLILMTVLSLLPLPAMADACYRAHEKACSHGSFTDYFSYNVYEQANATNHYVLEMYNRICNGCGKNLGQVQGERISERHSFSGNSCSKCGYTKPADCQHSSTSDQYIRSNYKQLNSTHHQVQKVFNRTCNSCGKNLGEVKGDWQNATHTFSGNTCTACGYQKADAPCEHPSFREEYLYNQYLPYNETHHHVQHVNRKICNSCGKNLGQTTGSTQRELHEFANGVCKKCDAPCAHVYGSDYQQAVSGSQAWAMLDHEYHTVLSQEYTAVCTVCGMEATLRTNADGSQKEKHHFDKPIWVEWAFDAQHHWRYGGRFCTAEGCVYAERMTESPAAHSFDKNGVCNCGYQKNFKLPEAFTQALSAQDASSAGLIFLLDEANNPVFTDGRDTVAVEWLRTIMSESLNELTGGWALPADLFMESTLGASFSGQSRNNGAVNTDRLAMQLKEYLHCSFNQHLDTKKLDTQLKQMQDAAAKDMLQSSRETAANELAAEYQARINKLNAFQRSFEMMEESEYKKALLKAVFQLKEEYEAYAAQAWQAQFFFSDPALLSKGAHIENLVRALKALQQTKQPMDAAVVSVLETGLMCGAMLKVEKALMNREAVSMMDYLDYQDCADFVYASRLSQCREYRGYSRQIDILQNLLVQGQ